MAYIPLSRGCSFQVNSLEDRVCYKHGADRFFPHGVGSSRVEELAFCSGKLLDIVCGDRF
jgi:hypothetical protein